MELGSREWYQQALADVREVWEGAPPGVAKGMPMVDSNQAGVRVTAQRRGKQQDQQRGYRAGVDCWARWNCKGCEHCRVV